MSIKLIAISDLHQGNPISLPTEIDVVSQEKLIKNLIRRKPDGILIAGDLEDYMWNLGSSSNSSYQIKRKMREDRVFNALNRSDVPVFYIWGNTDVMDCEKENNYQETPLTDDIRDWFNEEFPNLNNCHNKVHNIENLPILGYNDANKTTDEHSGKCWEEPTILKNFQSLILGLNEEEQRRSIFLTHTPPRGVLDFSSLGGKHIGSYNLRELIEEFQPLLSIFGHVHYCGGYSEFIGQTQCMNVSSFGLALSHDILFGQSAFELQINSNYEISSTTMIVSHYWKRKRKIPFIEYRQCHVCGRHAPFARRQFKTCRVCLGAKRIENKLKQRNENS